MKYLLILCLVPASMSLGCSSPKKPDHLDPLHPVEGRVFLDGVPLTKGEISFVPDHEKGNPYHQWSTAKIKPDGTYQLETFKRPGVQPGWYKVLVLAMEREIGELETPTWIVDEKYTKVEKTDLSVEVTAETPATAYEFRVVGPIE